SEVAASRSDGDAPEMGMTRRSRRGSESSKLFRRSATSSRTSAAYSANLGGRFPGADTRACTRGSAAPGPFPMPSSTRPGNAEASSLHASATLRGAEYGRSVVALPTVMREVLLRTSAAKIGRHTSELQSLAYLVFRLQLERKN